MRIRTGRVQGGLTASCSILIPFVAKTTVRQRTGDGYYPFPDENLPMQDGPVQAERAARRQKGNTAA